MSSLFMSCLPHALRILCAPQVFTANVRSDTSRLTLASRAAAAALLRGTHSRPVDVPQLGPPGTGIAELSPGGPASGGAHILASGGWPEASMSNRCQLGHDIASAAPTD